MPPDDSPPRIGTVVALTFAALAMSLPFTVRGIACGHDLAFHMNGWMEVVQQWRQGIVYPSWAAFANFGSGEPRFLFYPPLSWILGGLLGVIIPWMFAPVAFDCCAVVLAGLAMHRMAREWFAESDARLMAVAYAVSPYMLLNLYVRSAFAEMLATAFLPLLVLWIVRDRPAREMFVPLAFTIAGIWLTNVPAAVMATYVAVLLLTIVTVFRRNSRVFAYGAAALAAGMAIASFYILPVLWEKNWISLGQVLSAGARPAENFLFTRTGEPFHDRFLRTLSLLATGELLVTAIAMVAARGWRRRCPRLWWSLAILSVASLLLMLPLTGWAYRLLPELRYLQFPWRWLLVLGLGYAVFLVTAVPKFPGMGWIYGMLFVALIGGCNYALQAHCAPADTSFMISNEFHTGYGYMGTDEYVPAGGDNYEIKPDFPDFRFRAEEDGLAVPAAGVTHFSAATYNRKLTVESPRPVEIELRLMNYPAWRVRVNGRRVIPASDEDTGRMVIALPAGHSDIDVRFAATPDRWIGVMISLAALTFVARFCYVDRRRRLQ